MKTHLTPWPTAAATVLLALSACQSTPTRIYPLMPSPPATPTRTSSPMLRVDSVHVPPDWDRIEILTPSADGGLKINDLDRWAAPLGQALRQVLTSDLESRMTPGTVVYPHLTKTTGALGINLDILEFFVRGSEGTLRASWTITPAQNPAAATRSSGTFRTAISGDTPLAITTAWSMLLGQIADHIASDAAASSAPE